MKGMFFQKPLQYSIELDGESWGQGSQLTGKLKVENLGKEALSLAGIGAHLCFGNIKKLKAKDKSGIEVLQSIEIPNSSIKPSQAIELPLDYQLKEDCSITDSQGTMLVTCGEVSNPFAVGILNINISPSKPILDFIEIFELFFKFKFKPLKNKKDFIEAKVDAPDSKPWSSIQSLTVKMKVHESQLEIHFNFKLKKMIYDTSGMNTKDSTLEIKKILTEKEYKGHGGSPNQEGIRRVIDETLEKVKLKPLI